MYDTHATRQRTFFIQILLNLMRKFRPSCQYSYGICLLLAAGGAIEVVLSSSSGTAFVHAVTLTAIFVKPNNKKKKLRNIGGG